MLGLGCDGMIFSIWNFALSELYVTGVQKYLMTTFCMVAPNMCRLSVWYLLCVNFVAARILRWLGDSSKTCGLLMNT